MSTGRVKALSAQINGMVATGNGAYAIDLIRLKNGLLTNNYQAPIPSVMLNQRQKRKRARQNA